MNAASIPCSVLVLTRNSASSLDRCLRNLAQFGEILVHDGNSVDNTREIAAKYGARILKQYDTDEPSVRVKDFTEIRLKQRSDAAFDWVLYLDADEELTDSLVAEIGEILKTAHEKVIVKFPRYPMVEGKIRTVGLYNPEIMPRIHNRKGGCTLRNGKTVHEKYEYDSSFTEVVTKNPLVYPLPPLKGLQSKDNRYITLEVEKIQRDGLSRSHYVRWVLFREPFIILSLFLRILLIGPRYLSKNAMPIGYDWRYVRYHWRLFKAITFQVICTK